MTLRDDVLKTTAIMADAIASGEHAVVERLVAQGYSYLQAEVLVAFVPLGLGRAVIARSPANPPLALPDTVLVRDSVKDRDLEIRLSDVPEFMMALQLGEETFATGIIPREQFGASCNSVEFNLVNQALNAGQKLDGARLAPPILLRLAEAPGFREWYQELARR